jgi:hypothetical protein
MAFTLLLCLEETQAPKCFQTFKRMTLNDLVSFQELHPFFANTGIWRVKYFAYRVKAISTRVG